MRKRNPFHPGRGDSGRAVSPAGVSWNLKTLLPVVSLRSTTGYLVKTLPGCKANELDITKLRNFPKLTPGVSNRLCAARRRLDQCFPRETSINGLLTLPVANFGSHATLLATHFSSTLTRLLRTHEPAISGIRTEMPLRKGRRIARVHDSFKRGMPIAQFGKCRDLKLAGCRLTRACFCSPRSKGRLRK